MYILRGTQKRLRESNKCLFEQESRIKSYRTQHAMDDEIYCGRKLKNLFHFTLGYSSPQLSDIPISPPPSYDTVMKEVSCWQPWRHALLSS
jgi:hypothetical protein